MCADSIAEICQSWSLPLKATERAHFSEDLLADCLVTRHLWVSHHIQNISECLRDFGISLPLILATEEGMIEYS